MIVWNKNDEEPFAHDQFSPEADEGLCPVCGAEPKGFRVFALYFVAVAMFIAGVALGFIGGCEWHSHITQTIAQN